MHKRDALWSIAAALLFSGCADVAVPRFLHPGSEEYQQTRAQRFDPYPMTDSAPEIVGGRPLQYIKPAPENERVQNDLSFEERYHQQPPPGLYRPFRTAGGRRQAILYPVVGAPQMIAGPPAAWQTGSVPPGYAASSSMPTVIVGQPVPSPSTVAPGTWQPAGTQPPASQPVPQSVASPVSPPPGVQTPMVLPPSGTAPPFTPN